MLSITHLLFVALLAAFVSSSPVVDEKRRARIGGLAARDSQYIGTTEVPLWCQAHPKIGKSRCVQMASQHSMRRGGVTGTQSHTGATRSCNGTSSRLY
ncbi:hypothetical protein PTTG_26055 [Puccinia triticina 1-1 BBBD Race 1]|uniref:Secreted protein n=1 Tax=Puccinia triticina (isolate 1-1 / race 1 (BBBD)) TaxID=630390 RepID=A0A180GYQ2_PUCT1|nr:hypothetical protein PTTG_26055 [Puccinia triticina 1-1 BBBD Race 1]